MSEGELPTDKWEKLIRSLEPGTLFRAQLFDGANTSWFAPHRAQGGYVTRLTPWTHSSGHQRVGNAGADYPLAGMWDVRSRVEIIRLDPACVPVIETLLAHGRFLKAAKIEGFHVEVLAP